MTISIVGPPYPPPDLRPLEAVDTVTESTLGRGDWRHWTSWFNKLAFDLSYRGWVGKRWKERRTE